MPFLICRQEFTQILSGQLLSDEEALHGCTACFFEILMLIYTLDTFSTDIQSECYQTRVI